MITLATICPSPGFAKSGPLDGVWIGDHEQSPINLYIARTQLTRDPADGRVQALKTWLTQVARQASVSFQLRPASAERWQVQLTQEPDSCALANARLPDREQSAHWLLPVLRDSLVIVGRADDPYQGDVDALLRLADGAIGAASGIYRVTLEQRGIRYIPVDDQGAIIQMIDMGRLRFGLLVGSAAQTHTGPGRIRILGKIADMDFWFSCSRLMEQERVARLRKALEREESERLRLEFLALWARRPAP
ncbi:hypothetical protein GE253_00285 [Niveispirillum sp. SYP-B3756]|uniref:hypothetical protein n=1 Tax=Niveispirillum sp. SYP-B3756 TaxID=2662178 RepID=UPI001290C332|nr:hypothetical protein [Niveispirillum sp. SYP-B3756]MQP63773.1 hypothetical protein [Niveispirillum sp. SYP-B3756]